MSIIIPAGLLMVGSLWGVDGTPQQSESNGTTQRVTPGSIQCIPVGAIGWTQDSISPRVFDINSGARIPIRDTVTRALNDPRGAAAFLRENFQPIRIFYHETNGLLSIDNRRLAIFRLSLPPATIIPVRIMTREEAGRQLKLDNPRGRYQPDEIMAQRLSTTDGGYSINIRLESGEPWIVSQGDSDIPSPFVQPTYTHEPIYAHDEL